MGLPPAPLPQRHERRAGLILTNNRGLRQDMARLESRLDGRIGGLEERLREDMGKMESRLREDTSQLRDDIKQLGERVARMEHGQAKLEGLLEGLREARDRRGFGWLFGLSAQVPLGLPAPELGILYGTRVVLGTAMPETAVDEDGDLATEESEVGSIRQTEPKTVPKP